MLPEAVIERAKEELFSYKRTGHSVMEISRNTREFDELVRSARESLRRILGVPQNYKILFVPGGEESQYAAIPLNVLSSHKCADYIISGQHSKLASLEAKKYGDIVVAATSAGANPPFSTVPETKRSSFRPDADYVYMCYNNSIYGTRFHYVPDTGNIPLVADMSCFLLSEPIDVSKYALIYSSSEYCIGPTGMTIVIVRDDIVGDALAEAPSTLNYKILSQNALTCPSVPVWCIYMAKLVFEWIESVGGLVEIKRRNERKASLIYDYLDSQFYYTAPVDKKCRSMLNVVFVTGDANLDRKFAKEAKKAGFINLSGDNSVGGMRVSLYNAMSYEGVEELVKFMKKFALENPKIDT